MTLFIHTTCNEHIAYLRTAGDCFILIGCVIKHGDDIGVAFDDLVEHFLDFVHGLFSLCNRGDDRNPVPLCAYFNTVIQNKYEYIILAFQLQSWEYYLTTVLFYRFFTL